MASSESTAFFEATVTQCSKPSGAFLVLVILRNVGSEAPSSLRTCSPTASSSVVGLCC